MLGNYTGAQSQTFRSIFEVVREYQTEEIVVQRVVQPLYLHNCVLKAGLKVHPFLCSEREVLKTIQKHNLGGKGFPDLMNLIEDEEYEELWTKPLGPTLQQLIHTS